MFEVDYLDIPGDCNSEGVVPDGILESEESSIEALYKEAKNTRQRSLNCSKAAYRSRIVQMTYIYNSMACTFNNMSPKPQVLLDKIEWVRGEINSMWEAHNEW